MARAGAQQIAELTGKSPETVTQVQPNGDNWTVGIEVLEAGPERVVARMPVAGNVQPFGLLHGGATAALCETVGSVGASLAAAPDRTAVGIELNINHLRAVTDGSVIATGIVLRAGRSIAVWDVRVHDDGGGLVAAGRLTLAIRDSR